MFPMTNSMTTHTNEILYSKKIGITQPCLTEDKEINVLSSTQMMSQKRKRVTNNEKTL